MIGAFLDSISFIIIIPPLTIACIAMSQGAGVHWSVILKDLGVPLGLLMCFIGFVGMAANTSDPSLLGPQTASMLLPLLYGGILASIGYFWRFKFVEFVNVPLDPNAAKWWAPSVSVMFFLAILIWVMGMAAGLKFFYSSVPLGVCAITALVAVIISNRENIPRALSQSLLLGAMLNVLIGLIYYYQGEKQGLETALLGVTYAFIAYICLYFLTYKIGDPKKLDAPLMNWHWLEVSGFIIFMFLSPASLKEDMLNIESDMSERKMELRIQELERKLDLLSHQPAQ
ncbi:MAG: hypothetical protein HOE21_09565 [Proteobacteria bacterium]|nr:hypothetical protein [Pseudomonadota bacterium]